MSEVHHPGIPGARNEWFQGQGQARQAALALATRMGPGYGITHDPHPAQGLPHYHIVAPDGRRVSGHFFYGRRPPRRVYRGRPWREAEVAVAATEGHYQDEAMLRRPRGRPHPPRGSDIVMLYHYSPNIIRNSISPGSFWTSFGGRNPQDVARITGRDPTALRYRYALRLTRADRDRLFRNVATVMRPGLPASDEYRSRQPIPSSWFQSMQPIQ